LIETRRNNPPVFQKAGLILGWSRQNSGKETEDFTARAQDGEYATHMHTHTELENDLKRCLCFQEFALLRRS
jgi:hypothetical protein